MKNFTSEQIEQAKCAANVEELMELAKRADIEMTAEQASYYFSCLHPASGEISDEELDNVSGGGCQNGDGYTVVTCDLECFTRQFECVRKVYHKGTSAEIEVWERTDNLDQREIWWNMTLKPHIDYHGRIVGAKRCGRCKHLEFTDWAIGYCGKSK